MRDGWADGATALLDQGGAARRGGARWEMLLDRGGAARRGGARWCSTGPDAARVEERRGWGVGAVDVGLEERRGRGRRRRWPEIEQGDEGGGGERAVCVCVCVCVCVWVGWGQPRARVARFGKWIRLRRRHRRIFFFSQYIP